MAATMLLDRSTWDCTLDASGNMALATEPYAQAQDVASACRCYRGECLYATDKGLQYFERILGRPQPLAILKTQLTAAALTVPGVVSATPLLTAIVDRGVSGQMQFVTSDGTAGTSVL